MNFKLMLALPILCVAGCASLPPFNFSVPDVAASSRKVDANLKSVTVTIASPKDKTGRIDPGTSLITTMWKDSLQDVLDRSAVFQDNSLNSVSLDVKILQVDIPGAGITFTTHVDARYDIINRTSGAVVFSKTIPSEGTVPLGYAALGLTRQRESINRAIQSNIATFLQSLESSGIDAALFRASP
ncbi:MAG: hypothetical protein ABI306_10855 [Caulobacteraceae bacterium]